MTKIDQKQHITKDGVIKRNPPSLQKVVVHLKQNGKLEQYKDPDFFFKPLREDLFKELQEQAKGLDDKAQLNAYAFVRGQLRLGVKLEDVMLRYLLNGTVEVIIRAVNEKDGIVAFMISDFNGKDEEDDDYVVLPRHTSEKER